MCEINPSFNKKKTPAYRLQNKTDDIAISVRVCKHFQAQNCSRKKKLFE